MKYIIEFEDEPYMREDGVNYYTCKSARWYKLGETIINRLTPYTEPDLSPLVDEAVETIENEVWEFASMLMNMHPDVAEDIYWSMNGGKGIGVAAEMTYQEAKAKYDAWSKQNIREGDEVIYNSRTRAVVLKPETEEKYGTILTSEFATITVSHDDLEKTGRCFPEIAELLKKMKEKSE